MGAGPEEQLAASLAATGTEFAFGMPGGGANLTMLQALSDAGIRFVLAHAETPACIMAATYGYVSRSVSAAVVTRGPGAASAANGAAQATLDRHPLILVTDSVATDQRSRIAHQRLDQTALFAPLTKASVGLSPGIAETAVSLAQTSPAGCVHLNQDPSAPRAGLPPVNEAEVDSADHDAQRQIAAAVAEARRPLVIVGLDANHAADEVRPTLEALGAPVLSTYQAVGIIPTNSPINAGLFTNGAPEQTLMANADLIILLGMDLVEPIPRPWQPTAPVVAISSTPTLDAYVSITDEAVGEVGKLAQQCLRRGSDPSLWPPDTATNHRSETLRHLRNTGAAEPHGAMDPLGLVDTVHAWAAEVENLTTTVDAGAHFLAIMPLWEVEKPKRLLISNGLATMGYAVPAAIGAALARTGQPVLALTGDGGLGMTLAELETIARLDLPITVVVFNDAALSLIRIKQQPGEGGTEAVSFLPTDFAAVARAHGLTSHVATSPAELTDALSSWDGASPRLIDARVDPTTYPHLLRATRG